VPQLQLGVHHPDPVEPAVPETGPILLQAADQQVDVEPALPLPAHPPDHVALPAAQLGRDVAPGDPLQGREVEVPHPVLQHEAAEQVRHHLGMGKKTLVAVVVVRHRRSIRASCPGTAAFFQETRSGATVASIQDRRGSAGRSGQPEIAEGGGGAGPEAQFRELVQGRNAVQALANLVRQQTKALFQPLDDMPSELLEGLPPLFRFGSMRSIGTLRGRVPTSSFSR
jgi:hypothetical protein